MDAIQASEKQKKGVIAPTVEELIALRADVARHRPAKRAQTVNAGPSLSPIRGRGMEYAESREYVAGDDARHIDWRLTARTGRAHTKLFQAETERLTAVFVDVSPSLFFGSRKRYKSVQAARVAACAIWSAVRDGDRVGIVVPGSARAPRRFVTGVRGALPLMHLLAGAYASPGVIDTAAFRASLAGMRTQLRQGARLVIVADVHSLTALPHEVWGQLQGVEVHVVLIIDALEQAPPPKTLPVRLGAVRALLALDQATAAARWREYFTSPLERFQMDARGLGLHVHVVRADEDAANWLQRFNAPQAHVA